MGKPRPASSRIYLTDVKKHLQEGLRGRTYKRENKILDHLDLGNKGLKTVG